MSAIMRNSVGADGISGGGQGIAKKWQTLDSLSAPASIPPQVSGATEILYDGESDRRPPRQLGLDRVTSSPRPTWATTSMSTAGRETLPLPERDFAVAPSAVLCFRTYARGVSSHVQG